MSIAVVFDFCAESQMHSVANELNFVLEECVEEVNCPFIGVEGDNWGISNIIVRETVACAPEDVVSVSDRETMLEIDVSSVPVLLKHDTLASCGVVVCLTREV